MADYDFKEIPVDPKDLERLAEKKSLWYESKEDREERLRRQEYLEVIKPVLKKAIQKLPRRQREAVILYFYKNKTQKEVGTILGITRQAAAKLLKKALINLKAELKG